MIPDHLQDDFYSGKINDTVKFAINDSVEIITGDYKGQLCAVISIDSIYPEVEFLLERGDDGSLIKARQAILKSIE